MPGIFFHGTICFFQGFRHGRDSRDILCSGAFAALLSPAFDQVREADAFSRIQEPDTFGAVELVCGRGEQIDFVILNIYGNMSDSLDRIHVEGNSLSPADLTDFTDRLDRADFIVGVHDRHETGILANGCFRLRGTDYAIFMDIKKGDLKTFLLQRFQCVQHGMMLKCCRNDVHFAALFSDGCNGTDGLVVGLATAGSESDCIGGRADYRSDFLPRFFEDLPGILSVCIKA